MAPRYAIYFPPERQSVLEEKAASWLGRDLDGSPLPRPAVPGFTPQDLDSLTADPARYGFHATLKAPFVLARDRTEEELHAAASAFASTRTTFAAPPLRMAEIGQFLALVPAQSCPDLDALAADCVRTFDPFRAPPPAEELARRRAGGLSERQNRLLETWGYPYVMEEFRFHMTLTGRVPDSSQRRALMVWLSVWLADAVAGPLRIDGIAIYRQADRDSPFVLTERFPFADQG